MNLHTLTNWMFETPVTPDPDLVTPTWVGFVATFLVAVAVALILFDMARRVRRTNYRAQVSEKLDAEQREAEQFAADEAAPDADPGAAPGTASTDESGAR